MNSIVSLQNPVLLSETPLWMSEIVGHVQAGFPSPAEDLGGKRIDLTELLVTHPQATYLLRVHGWSMKEAGIFDNDIVVVNRAIRPRHKHIVVAIVDGDFTVKYLHQRPGSFKLKAANPTYADIIPKEGQIVQVWGVVTSSIKQYQV